MNKQIIFVPGLLAVGILLGIFIIKLQQDVAPTIDTDDTQAENASPVPFQQNSPFNVIDENRAQQLATQIAELQARVEMLEAELQQPADPEIDDYITDNSRAFSSTVDTPITARTRIINISSLTKASIDATTAADIVRRKSELELKKLELRDNASREGYAGTRRHMEELEALTDSDISLREELGDDIYDRYLFASGQANRVRVASVMMGSAAEQAGMKNNDLILNYNDERLFDWTELQHATTQGDRSDYVNVTVVRDGVEMVLWLPRGPLGVRLTTTRVDPDK
jgi:hypothetical protein